jgi:hypothetical protein
VITRLDPPIPVTFTGEALPPGLKSESRRGWCYAWREVGIDGHRLWVVAFDDTGEVVDVPQPEVVVDMNWSIGRRAPAPRPGEWQEDILPYHKTVHL